LPDVLQDRSGKRLSAFVMQKGIVLLSGNRAYNNKQRVDLDKSIFIKKIT